MSLSQQLSAMVFELRAAGSPVAKAKALGLESPQGVLIEDFVPKDNSPAQLGGLKRGDVIVAMEGRRVVFSHQLQEMIAKRRPGETIEITVFRDGERITRQVTLGSKEIPGDRAVLSTRARLPKTSTLGMQLRNLTDEDLVELGLEQSRGVVVERVADGGPALKAGLRVGDVILEVNRRPVNSVEELRDTLDDVSPGTAILFMIIRGGTTRFIGLELPG